MSDSIEKIYCYGDRCNDYGYDGMIFCRWVADMIGKSAKINWEKFI